MVTPPEASSAAAKTADRAAAVAEPLQGRKADRWHLFADQRRGQFGGVARTQCEGEQCSQHAEQRQRPQQQAPSPWAHSGLCDKVLRHEVLLAQTAVNSGCGGCCGPRTRRSNVAGDDHLRSTSRSGRRVSQPPRRRLTRCKRRAGPIPWCHSAASCDRPPALSAARLRRVFTRRLRISLRMALRCRATNSTVQPSAMTSSGRSNEA